MPEDLIEAIVDKTKLESYGISMNQLYQAVSNNNRVIPAGFQDTGTGRFAVNVPSVFSSLEDIETLPIKVSGTSVVTLKDVADVSLTFKDRGGYSRINGQQSLALDIKKRIGTNIIDTVTDIRKMVEDKIESFPEGVDVNFVRDDSKFALQMISELQGNVLTSIALVMIVVLAALGFRTSMLVGMAIPFSYLFALLVLLILDKEFNFMVMFGMLISMGMTIDGSIVVTEYADRKLAEGMNRIEAYTAAATRMFWPVLSSTTTTLIAFTPLMFMPGFGAFIRDMPITVFCVLVGSLLYSLIFAPILGAMFGGLAKQSEAEINYMKSAARISGLLKNSQIKDSHKDCDRVQDAYCFRCGPQVHGPAIEALIESRRILEIEINSATDNPLVFVNEGKVDIISGGNFHGQNLAIASDNLAIICHEIAVISERRINQILDPQWSNLSAFLTNKEGLESGLMIIQYVAAAIISELHLLANPATTSNVPVSMGKEDHVSMGATGTYRSLTSSKYLSQVLANELICATEALERLNESPGLGVAKIKDWVRTKVDKLDGDKSLTKECEELSISIINGEMSEIFR